MDPGASSGLDAAQVGLCLHHAEPSLPHPFVDAAVVPAQACTRILAAGGSGFLLGALFATFELTTEKARPSEGCSNWGPRHPRLHGGLWRQPPV